MSRAMPRVVIALCLLALAQPARGASTGRLRYLTTIDADDKGVAMQQPEGLACNAKGTLIVADAGTGHLLRYSVQGRDVKPLGTIEAPQLAVPIRVQMNSRGEIFALDGRERRIVRFAADGAFKGYLSPDGVPAPTSVVPRSFRIDGNDSIYLLDVFSARVLVLDAEGRYQRDVPFPKDYGFFSDLDVDSRGGIYLIDSVNAALLGVPKDGREFSPIAKALRPPVRFPTALVADPRGIFYVVDQHGGDLVTVGPNGSVLGRQLAMGWTPGLLRDPTQICLDRKGHAFIADRGNSRVQMFSITQ